MSLPASFKWRRWLFPALLVCAALLLLLPIRPLVTNRDTMTVSHVAQYYKGLRQEEITDANRTDRLALFLRLYDTSILPTVSSGTRQVSATYYEIHGQLNGRPFTITADDSAAVLFFHGQSRGYRLQDGDLLVPTILGTAAG